MNQQTATQTHPLPRFAADDARLAEALESYLRAVESGDAKAAEQVCEAHPDIAEDLRAAIEGIDFLCNIAPQLTESRLSVSPDPSDQRRSPGTNQEVGRAQGARRRSLDLVESPDRRSPDALDSAIRIPNSAIETLGDFQILRELGRGGMGVVYEALQLSLDRRVALKVLPFAGMLDARQLARFQNEARAAATLFHPNIVPVFHVSVDRGVHHYAMQLIEGQSLAEAIGQMRNADFGLRNEEADTSPNSAIRNPRSAIDTVAALSTVRSENPREYFRTVANIGAQIADALEHSHNHGVIHRDVKPANILFDNGGKPWITDFGLARIGADAGITMSGDLLGTLRYMSPEAALAKGVVDHRTDIYSLGATLYESLALVPALTGNDRGELLRQIADETPRPLTSRNIRIPKDLETIVGKAMEKDPADRYTSAADLADDLRSFADHRPIAARPPSLATRAQKWARRHPSQLLAATAALAVCLLAAAIAFTVSSVERRRTADALDEKSIALEEAQTERDRANEQFRRAEDERERAVDSLKLARNIVDALYMQVGTKWIADETAPSNLQEGILSAAVRFYEDLTETQITRPGNLSELSLVSSGYQRIGLIQHYLQNFEGAVAARKSTVEVVRQALAVEPKHPGIRSSLAESQYELGQSLVELARFDEALAAFEKSSDATEQFVDEEFQPIQHRYWLARNKLARAAALAHQGDLTEAGRLAQAAKDELTDVLNDADRSEIFWNDLRNNTFRADYWLAKTAAYKGDPAGASQTCQRALNRCRRIRTTQEIDAAPLRRLEIDLTELAAELAALNSDLSMAAEQYGQVLEMRRESLRSGLAPEQFLMASGFKRSLNLDGLLEPGPFCGYVETHLRLADVLRRTGQPYAAENILGEGRTVTTVLAAHRPNALRYRIAHANVFAMSTELLADIRPSDAEILYRAALQTWADATAEFPHAKEYVSGVHGLQPDWEYFQTVGSHFAHLPDAESNESDVDASQTVWHQHSSGHSWAGVELWKEAIAAFEKSAALRIKDHAYDWFQLAIAHAHLGEQEQAQEWLEKAIAEIETMTDPHSELIELRDEAASVLDKIATQQ